MLQKLLGGTLGIHYLPTSAPMTKENPELDPQLILCTTTTLGTPKYYCSSEDSVNFALVLVGLDQGKSLLIGSCCSEVVVNTGIDEHGFQIQGEVFAKIPGVEKRLSGIIASGVPLFWFLLHFY